MIRFCYTLDNGTVLSEASMVAVHAAYEATCIAQRLQRETSGLEDSMALELGYEIREMIEEKGIPEEDAVLMIAGLYPEIFPDAAPGMSPKRAREILLHEGKCPGQMEKRRAELLAVEALRLLSEENSDEK